MNEVYHGMFPLLMLLSGQLDILFEHTVEPFIGCIGRWVVWCIICLSSKKDVKDAELNCTPLSETMFSRFPWRLNTVDMNVSTVPALVSLTKATSGHLL